MAQHSEKVGAIWKRATHVKWIDVERRRGSAPNAKSALMYNKERTTFIALSLTLSLLLPASRITLGAEGVTRAIRAKTNVGDDTAAWGKPVYGQVISISCEKLSCACGEPIFLLIRLKNIGSVPVLDPREQRFRPKMSYSFDVSGASGACLAGANQSWRGHRVRGPCRRVGPSLTANGRKRNTEARPAICQSRFAERIP